MDMMPFAGMVFALLMVLIIGGFSLLAPLSKRLGDLLEMRITERRDGTIPPEQAAGLVEAVQALQDQVERLEQRQAFTERLLERPADQAEV